MITFPHARRLRLRHRKGISRSENKAWTLPVSQALGDAGVGAIAAIVGSILVFLGGFVTAWFAFQSKDQELREKLVEIAIGILRADPKEDIAPARGWAITVIERNAGVKFSEEDRAALLHRPLKSEGYDVGSDYLGYVDTYSNDYVAREGEAWTQATQQNTPYSYSVFLKAFPSGPHHNEAKARIKQLETMDK